MLRVVREYRWIRGPVFVELRRELDEVARHAAQHGIANIGKHRVERVTEFVEHRGDVVEAQLGRMAGARLAEVADVDDDRL